MERDKETGFGYHSARYYLPWLGRWLNCDPIGIKGGLNLYCYCGGNPTHFSDTNGTDEIGDTLRRADINKDRQINRTEFQSIINSSSLPIKDFYYYVGASNFPFGNPDAWTFTPDVNKQIHEMILPELLVEEYTKLRQYKHEQDRLQQNNSP